VWLIRDLGRNGKEEPQGGKNGNYQRVLRETEANKGRAEADSRQQVSTLRSRGGIKKKGKGGDIQRTNDGGEAV